MKKSLLSIALALATLSASAAPRTAQQALDIARRFAMDTPSLYGMRSAALSLAPTSSAQMSKGTAKATAPAYYVCNFKDNGFVIVSGDDRFKEVLGYSLNGEFAADQMPDGLKYWLSFLSDEMAAAIESGYEPAEIKAQLYASNVSQSVAPLLKTRWNQNSPYNNKINGNMTGCVATGTAQVMNYWKYPAKGTGSHTGAYSPNYSADFGATTYDWAHMADEYGTGWESREEVEAVSTLMLHVGVATDMRWGTKESGTPNPYAAYALHHFFNYNPNLYIESRDQVSLGAWKALIIDQLQTGHPLCYAGMGSADGGVGHFFVCDGYSASDGKFHFNWGWSGLYDGYYALTALEPGTGGIGAGVGTYNYWQSIFVNVQPEKTGEYHANFDAITSKVTGNNKSSLKLNVTQVTNNNTYDFKGTIGLAVYNEDGSLNKYIASGENFPVAGHAIGHMTSGTTTFNVNAQSLEDGTYTVCVAVWSDRDQNVHPVRAKYDNDTYYTMKVSGSSVNITPASREINLTEESALVLASNGESNMFQNIVAHFKVTVKNNTAVTFNDEIGVFVSGGRGSNQYITAPALIAAGETKVIDVYGAPILNVKDGYTVKACYGNNGTYTTFGDALTVNIKAEADGIQTIVSDPRQSSSATYNLTGQRVDNATKGIVISKGKKIINK